MTEVEPLVEQGHGVFDFPMGRPEDGYDHRVGSPWTTGLAKARSPRTPRRDPEAFLVRLEGEKSRALAQGDLVKAEEVDAEILEFLEMCGI